MTDLIKTAPAKTLIPVANWVMTIGLIVGFNKRERFGFGCQFWG
jgi:hypothetical protein|uniref:Transmembrane protein n=1 Tax=Arabidopsis thaliana TaxID=3702 RepID=Q0WKY8_ARATH|nr:hypothetical protein [Arabidopsis thaliana]